MNHPWVQPIKEVKRSEVCLRWTFWRGLIDFGTRGQVEEFVVDLRGLGL